MTLFRYSEWDGTQEIPPLDPDDVLEALTDDLMNFGDLQHAMRNLLQRGMRDPLGQRLQGLRDLLQQLRQQRRSTLDRYNLGSAFEDIERRLKEVLEMERATIDRRLQEVQGEQGEPDAGGQPAGDAGEAGEQSPEAATQPSAGQQQGQPDGGSDQRPAQAYPTEGGRAVDPAADDHRKGDPVWHLEQLAVDHRGHDQRDGHKPDRPVADDRISQSAVFKH